MIKYIQFVAFHGADLIFKPELSLRLEVNNYQRPALKRK